MEFNHNGEQWVRVKQFGAWAVFAVTGPTWIGSRFNVVRVTHDHAVLPGNRFYTLAKALESARALHTPAPKMHSYLSTGYHKFKL